MPDEDPFPCGGREKLRDAKFKWKPGDAFEFIGRAGFFSRRALGSAMVSKPENKLDRSEFQVQEGLEAQGFVFRVPRGPKV